MRTALAAQAQCSLFVSAARPMKPGRSPRGRTSILGTGPILRPTNPASRRGAFRRETIRNSGCGTILYKQNLFGKISSDPALCMHFDSEAVHPRRSVLAARCESRVH